jgi:pyridoxal phosphate enzyme (YggS family)
MTIHDEPSTALTENIAAKIAQVRTRIGTACTEANRSPESIKLVAVTKVRTVKEIAAALQSGIQHLGENRVEEAIGKITTQTEWLPANVSRPIWHMVGHVQSRKAQAVVAHFDWIHSLDSVKLARRYHNFLKDQTDRPQILIECNTSGEDAKSGLDAHQWETSPTQRQTLWKTIEDLATYTNVEIAGLMTMAPFTDNETVLRNTFARLRRLRDALQEAFPRYDWRELSMGMTNDYLIAVQEGATMVRIGRAIFGERPQ